ncbi:MAG TPA: MBL fold metallo-hydrolase [Verrucomicrobiae bacterium]|nr:MBL fold metallo-hydrolase [Verrucomicrobiae bacterium]
MRAWVWLLLLAGALTAQAQLGTSLRMLTNKEALLTITATNTSNVTLRTYYPPLDQFVPLLTFRSTGVNNHIDAAAPYLNSRFYASRYDAPTAFLGEHVITTNGDLIIQPVHHAGFVMSWNSKIIYNDPAGNVSRYTGFPKADLILLSHNHSDHFDATIISSLTNATTRIIAPQTTYNSMSAALKNLTTILTYGSSTTVFGIPVQAVRATNANHLEGVNNAYVTTIGGKRILTTGDCGPGPDLLAVQNIDVAFVCMNSFTMTATTASSVVRTIRPKVVFPYHFGSVNGSPSTDPNYDTQAFKRLVGQDLGIEVRLRKWY